MKRILSQIIPPESWKPLKPGFDFQNDESITFPVLKMEVKGKKNTKYLFRTGELKQRKTLAEYRKFAEEKEKKMEHIPKDQWEQLINDNKAPIKESYYAADVELTAFDPKNSILNMNSLHDWISNYCTEYNIEMKGIIL